MKSKNIRNLTGNNISVFECKFLHSTFSFILLFGESPELSASSAETTRLLNSDNRYEICVLPGCALQKYLVTFQKFL
jgi:hypothetical protein